MLMTVYRRGSPIALELESQEFSKKYFLFSVERANRLRRTASTLKFYGVSRR